MNQHHFPVNIIERENEQTHVQKARRVPGHFRGMGRYEFDGEPGSWTMSCEGKAKDKIEAALNLYRQGSDYLHSLANVPPVKSALARGRISTANAQVAWMEEHDVIAEALIGEDEPLVRLDLSWIDAFPATQKGLTVLAAFVHLYLYQILQGKTQREALHSLLDLYHYLPSTDREELLQVLQSRKIDSNQAFFLFLSLSYNSDLAKEMEQLDLASMNGLRTEFLFETGNRLEHELFRQKREGAGEAVELLSCVRQLAGKRNGVVISQEEVDEFQNRVQGIVDAKNGTAASDVVAIVEKTLKWRDKWVTWLMGQLRVDMPYDMTRVVRLMQEEIADVDEKRALINEAISSTYDLDLEGSNIRRISEWTRQSGMKLVAGRLSRAFGNQSQLLSVSKILADKKGLLPFAQRLHEASMGLRALQTQASRLLHLIQQHKPTPFAQTVGALNHFEESLFEYQSKEFKRMLQEKDDASRRVIGRPNAEMCKEALDTIQQRIRKLYQLAAEFRDELERTGKKPAAFIILMQRLHPAETINLANANLLRDVHPGKEDDLRDLMRQGGHYTYSTPGLGRVQVNGDPAEKMDTHWVIQVDDWIEAIPLFIHERVVHRTMKVGNEEIALEVIETEVDQEAMEVFFRLHAEFWAQNIEAVMDSQHVGLARRLLVQSDAELRREMEEFRQKNPDQTEDQAAYAVIAEKKELHSGVAALAAHIRAYDRAQVEEVSRRVELDDIPRIEALERIVRADKPSPILKLLNKGTAAEIVKGALKTAKGEMAGEVERLSPLVEQATRKTSSLHILTTESAGMTEGYVQTWIEEEMALFNIVRNQGLEGEVRELMNQYRTRIQAVARKIISEFGMSVVIDEVMAQQRLPEPAAVMTVLFSFKPLLIEAAKLAVLIEQAEVSGKRKVKFENADDPKEVDEYLQKNRNQLLKAAVPKVAENNGKAFEKKVQEAAEKLPKLSLFDLQKKVIASEIDYAEELEATVRFEARSRILEEIDKQNPEQYIMDQVRTYIRSHTQLAKSTARKRVVAKHRLNHLTVHPLNYYQAAGGNKRYNLLYTPSRVNLGERERDSVVKWRQWVGGADRFAAQAGFEFYSLINEGGVEERPALAYAEIQKTSENALCVTHFAGSNALALLCMAVLEGDVEDMADQMNLRHDRMIPPAGEGYGGYCVPKDGLFLAFVLGLQNDVKLRQMGIPERFHDGVMKMAKQVLLRQNDFESHFDWQLWAAQKLLAYKDLKKFFDVRDNILVYHITKIARAVENLGQPWHETAEGSKLVANLAAQWGVEKMIIRAEQVNRFMVFYKAWMIYDAIREAKQENSNCPAENEATVALTAEYKPVQDIRYSTGMRLFEILAQTGEHLTHSLDEEGQNLAYIMNYGFDPDATHPVGRRAVQHLLQIFRADSSNQEVIQRLKEAFPPHATPGDLIMTSVTMSSTQDLLFYTSDTKLEETAGQLQVILSDYGLTEDQIRANAIAHGGRLHLWAGIKQLPQAEQDELIQRVGGKIHALVLKMRGPGRDYERDIQGIDVLNAGIPFPQLLALLDNMPKVVALMRTGNPNSSLAITDGAAGRARRLLTYLDIQLFFAACEKIGRRGVYRAVGLGKRNIERLRDEMHRKRDRAERLYAAVSAIAQAKSDEQRTRAAEEALFIYRNTQELITADDEAGKALREEEKMKRYKKWKVRDYYISQSLAKISAGLPLQRTDFGTWISGFGGMFATINEAEESIKNRQILWNKGIEVLRQLKPDAAASEAEPFAAEELKEIWKHAVRPQYEPESQRFTQQMLVESSSKAVEIAAREALERRKALKARAERARAFNDREDGFKEVFQENSIPPFEESWKAAQQNLDVLRTDLKKIYAMKFDDSQRPALQSEISRRFGRIIGYTRASFARLMTDLLPEKTEEQRVLKKQILSELAMAFTGREIILEQLKKLMGGYENIGGIARLAEAAQGDKKLLDQVSRTIELFYITFALAQTLEFALQTHDEVDPAIYWKNLVDFFAESINDHWYEYWPWAYARGIGFREISDEEKYAMAVERHRWLYEYLRDLLAERTELRDWNEADRDALLGNYTEGKQVVGIGADGFIDVERAWRAYNQLREITFVKSDGFPMPEVFSEFDPAIIEADKRVNVAILFPIGRTHVSRALREGPTLNQEMQAKKKPGANLLISRYGEFAEVEGAKRKALLLSDAHLYISEEEYAQALMRHKKVKKGELKQKLQAAREQGRLTPKGIRIAARFVQNGEPAPIVAGSLIPFHGLPIYTSGETEVQGMPATIQSLIYTDLTYDKSLYPQIYTEETGVQLPPEIDWLHKWNAEFDGNVHDVIKDGLKDRGYLGLRTFAAEYPIILIKGAAESGARNLKVFEVQDDHARVKEDALQEAARFVYDVSRTQNVVIQAAVFTNPELWASPKLMQNFVDRQILEWNTPVNRDFYPRSQIYGTMRIVVSSSQPRKKYDTAFPISLMSLQVATNVGRGGTLDPLREEDIHPRFRKQIMNGLRAEGPKVMEAMNAYVREHGSDWEAQTGQKLLDDLRGVSYGWANYLMCDYVIMPVYNRRGRLVDIVPEYDENGNRMGSKPILQDENGRFEGEILDWKFIHLEPNVGIGLWDRYNLREEVYETQRSRAEKRAFDWDNIGTSDRIVLRNWVLAGEEYVKANFPKGIRREAVNQAG